VDASYFRHKSTGALVFDPGRGTKYYDPWWAIVECDQGIVDYYCWLCRRYGKPVERNKLWRAHISFLKGEQPPNLEKWGQEMSVEFYYSDQVRFDNGCHGWLDVWSDDLIRLREQFGLSPKLKMSYHITLGRMI
jgi:hypothetical protein